MNSSTDLDITLTFIAYYGYTTKTIEERLSDRDMVLPDRKTLEEGFWEEMKQTKATGSVMGLLNNHLGLNGPVSNLL